MFLTNKKFKTNFDVQELKDFQENQALEFLRAHTTEETELPDYLITDDSWNYLDKKKKQGYIAKWFDYKDGKPGLSLSFNNFKDPVVTFDTNKVISEYFEQKKHNNGFLKRLRFFKKKQKSEPSKEKLLEEQRKKENLQKELEAFDKLPQEGSHPYLKQKQIDGLFSSHSDIRYNREENCISLLLRDTEGNPRAIQKIYGKEKKFAWGSQKSGSFLALKPITSETKTLYIVEGFATGISVWNALNIKENKEINLVVAIDSNNLGKVSVEILNKYKEIKPIFVCDTDIWENKNNTISNEGFKKANRAALAVDGLLTIPDFSKLDQSSKPTDFNDLQILAGVEEVEKQLKQTFEPIQPEKELPFKPKPEERTQIEEKLLSPSLIQENKVNIFKSPTGTGKSKSYAEWSRNILENKRVLNISLLVSLVSQISEKTNTQNYKEFNNSHDDLYQLREENQLTICLNSLFKLEGAKPYDIVFIDETEQTLQQLCSNLLKKNRLDVFQVLKFILKQAKTIVLCDATMSDFTLNFFRELLPDKEINVVENLFKPHKNELFYLYNDEDYLLGEIKDNLKQGRRVSITSNSKKKCLEYKEILKQEFSKLNIFCITSENSSTEEGKSFLKDPETFLEENKVDVLISSPSLNSGFSIEKKLFDESFGFFFRGSNLPSDWHQAIHRVRNVEKRSAYVQKGSGNLPTDTELLKKNFFESLMSEENQALKNTFTDLNDEGKRVFRDELFAYLWFNNITQKNKQKNDSLPYLIGFLKSEGYEIIPVFGRKASEEEKELNKQGKELSKEKRIQEIVEAENIVEAQALQISRKNAPTIKEKKALAKFEIAEFYGETASNVDKELVEDYREGKTKKEVHRARMVSLSESEAIERSLKEFKKNQLEMDVTKYCEYQKLGQTLLEFAGISCKNGQLEILEDYQYDQKTLKEKGLGEFLSKNKARLNGLQGFPLKVSKILLESIQQGKTKELTRCLNQCLNQLGIKTIGKGRTNRTYTVNQESVDKLNELLRINYLDKKPTQDISENRQNITEKEPKNTHLNDQFLEEKESKIAHHKKEIKKEQEIPLEIENKGVLASHITDRFCIQYTGRSAISTQEIELFFSEIENQPQKKSLPEFLDSIYQFFDRHTTKENAFSLLKGLSGFLASFEDWRQVSKDQLLGFLSKKLAPLNSYT